MKAFLTLATCTFFTILTSCSDGGKPNISLKDCGEIKEYVVDKAYCERYSLREREFTVQYPSTLEVEDQTDFRSPNYVSFLKYNEDEITTLSMNIGYYYGVGESGEDGIVSGLLGHTKESLLQSLVKQLNQQGFSIENVEMDNEEVIGEEHFTLRATFNHKNDDFGFLGEYLMQVVMIETGEGKGVLLIMSGQKGSEVNDYNDFESSTCLSPILYSFKDN